LEIDANESKVDKYVTAIYILTFFAGIVRYVGFVP